MKSTGSNSGQIAILVALIALFIAIIYFAPMMKATHLAATDKKLRAKAGTEREGARALVSDTASATPKEQLKGTRDEPLEGWTAPKSWERLKEMRDEKEREPELATEALNALEPDEGIAQLRVQLLAVNELGATADLYAALGRLYSFRDPPDWTAAQTAFDDAARVAPSAAARHSIARDRILAMHADSSADDILEVVESAMREGDEVSLPTLELHLLKAAALENLNRSAEAIALYETVMDQALDRREENALYAEDIYRQGALRLARAYRAQGRAEEANAVARAVKRTVGSE